MAVGQVGKSVRVDGLGRALQSEAALIQLFRRFGTVYAATIAYDTYATAALPPCGMWDPLKHNADPASRLCA